MDLLVHLVIYRLAPSSLSRNDGKEDIQELFHLFFEIRHLGFYLPLNCADRTIQPGEPSDSLPVCNLLFTSRRQSSATCS